MSSHAGIHPAFASRFHLLEGIDSFEQALGDPVLKARLDAFFTGGTSAAAPAPVPTSSERVPGPHGPVPVRIYRPGDWSRDRPGAPCLVWMHGGAFQGGDLDMPEADWTAREIVLRTGATVVSVDYRLAIGGVTYPVPLDDVVAAVRWVRVSAGPLGVDAARIAVGGASAGANLAAGAVLRLRDEDSWQPACLLLAYPVVHPVLPPPSPALTGALAEVPPLLRFPPDVVEAITVNYLGGPVGGADGYAMPALADLAGLCRTLIVNAEYDDLRASGEALTAALVRAGVDASQVTAEGLLHGFLNHSAAIPPVAEVLDILAAAVTLVPSLHPVGEPHG